MALSAQSIDRVYELGRALIRRNLIDLFTQASGTNRRCQTRPPHRDCVSIISDSFQSSVAVSDEPWEIGPVEQFRGAIDDFKHGQQNVSRAQRVTVACSTRTSPCLPIRTFDSGPQGGS